MFFNTLWESRFVRNVAVLGTGTAAAQVLAIASAPILTRLYSPSDFGLFALFTAVVTTIAAAAAWTYPQAIVLPKRDGEAANIVGLCGIIVLFMTLVAAVFVLTLGDWLAGLLDAPALAPHLVWVPIAVLTLGLYQTQNFWAIRRTHYRRLSVSEIFRSAGIAGIQIASGLLNGGPAGLIGGNVAGQLLATWVLGLQIWRNDHKLLLKALSLTRIRRLAVQYRDFPKFNMPQTMLRSTTTTTPPVLLALFFDPATAGGYWLTYRVCKTPTLVIGDAVRRVFYQRAAAQYNRGRPLMGLLVKATVTLFLMMLLPVCIIVLFAPELYRSVFGPDWQQAGVYARWLIVWWTTSFASVPCYALIQVYGFQRRLLILEVSFLVPRLLSIPVGAYLADNVTAIAMYSSVGMLLNISVMAIVFSHTRRRTGPIGIGGNVVVNEGL